MGHHKDCACATCIRKAKRIEMSSSSEKTCNLCNVKGTCGIFRPLIIHLKNHSDKLGKDYDDIFAAFAYACKKFVPLPGGEGTTEYIAERHGVDECVDDCPLCEKEKD